MKKKDIFVVIMCLAILAVSSYYIFKLLFPASTATKDAKKEGTATEIILNGNINSDIINQVSKMTDYGEAPLDNIGRPNPFAPSN